MNEMSYPAESIVGTVDGPDRDSYRNARMELKDLTEISTAIGFRCWRD